MVDPAAVLAFWFGRLLDDGSAAEDVAARWFRVDPAFDAEVRARFGDALDAAGRCALDAWRDTPAGRLALVIVLDQFTRNARRGTPGAFANDARALEVAADAIARGDLAALPPMHAYFLAMPFMHAEALDAQARCAEAFRALAAGDVSDAVRRALASGLDFAERHRAIVARFGRFPHRNAALGRESTPEELAFLEQPGSRF